MGIKNPTLRFLAGFAVLALLFAALVFSYRYAAEGYSFIVSVFWGFEPVLILVIFGLCFGGLLRAIHWTGNRFFSPPVEDADEE